MIKFRNMKIKNDALHAFMTFLKSALRKKLVAVNRPV